MGWSPSFVAAARRGAALVLVGSLLAAVAQAKPPRRPKPTPTPQQQGSGGGSATEGGGQPVAAAPAGLEGIGERLWHYQTGEARAALGRYLDQVDGNAHVATMAGRVLEQERKYGEAESRLRRATELAPGEPAPWVYLGETYLRLRRNGDADAAFRKAAELARASGGGEAAYYLGVAQQRLKQYDEAVATLQGASAPAAALIPYQIGVTRAFQQRWAEAGEQLDRAIAADSGLAYAYYYRGLVHEKSGRKDLLVNDMERFLALAPEAPEAEQARAILRAVKR